LINRVCKGSDDILIAAPRNITQGEHFITGRICVSASMETAIWVTWCCTAEAEAVAGVAPQVTRAEMEISPAGGFAIKHTQPVISWPEGSCTYAGAGDCTVCRAGRIVINRCAGAFVEVPCAYKISSPGVGAGSTASIKIG